MIDMFIIHKILTEKGYVNVLYFEYKTFNHQVYKIKQTASWC